MNYRYGLLAVVLAVSSFAAPTLAGVTDLGDGKGDTKSPTVVNDHYKDNYVTDAKTTDDKVKDAMKGDKSFQDVKNNVINTKDSAVETGAGEGVTGTLQLLTTQDITVSAPAGFEKTSGSSISGWVNGYGTVSSNVYEFNFTCSSVDDLVTALVNIGGTQGHGGHSNNFYVNASGSWNIDRSYSGSWDKSTWHEDITASDINGSLGTGGNGEVYLNKEYGGLHNGTKAQRVTYQVDKNLDSSTKTSIVTSDAGTVMVGDPDSLFSAYSASGGTTTSTIVDNYYTRTFHQAEQQIQDQRYEKNTTYVINIAKAVTPIVLDLDGDGKIEASNGQYLAHSTFSDNRVALFDFYNNGFPVFMEWVGANDGLLCRPNADGSVNGSNLFGVTNGFENGYEELASLDANNDGQLSGTELQGLKVWTDVNGDAVAQANELKSLDELGITSIKVSHNNYSSTFVRNGQTFKSFDWWPNAKELRKVDMASVIGK